MLTEYMVKVLVVEDSITTRRFLVKLINDMPGLMVCGEAYDGLEAVRLTAELQPDVISMDIHMPRMDGVEATRQIMIHTPTPVVIASNGIGQREVDFSMQALAAGAVAVIQKPTAAPSDDARRMDYVRLLRYMAKVKVIRRYASLPLASLPMSLQPRVNAKMVVIGASAGGPAALAEILTHLPADFPLPIIIVQHLDPDFVEGFVQWLNNRSALTVRIAVEGEHPMAGHVLVAPGGAHTVIRSDGTIGLVWDKGNYRHQPAVDMLFLSAAEVFGKEVIAVLLTGMGTDGAEGMAQLYKLGAHTIVQDEATSVVYGMPAAAIKQNAAEFVLPDVKIAEALIELTQQTLIR